MNLITYDKVAVIGANGVGKTVFSDKVAQLYNLPHIQLDTLLFDDGVRKDHEDFRKSVEDVVSQQKWVCDGVFTQIADIVWPKADLVIWLDMPLRITVQQVVKRSLIRIVKGIKQPGGQKETLYTAFGSNGSVRLASHIHKMIARKYPPILSQYVDEDKLLHFTSRSQMNKWLESIDI
jgi:cytidylate kinase